jgi:hypothetical protein
VLLFEAVNTSDVMAWNSASFCNENINFSWKILSFFVLLSLHTRNECETWKSLNTHNINKWYIVLLNIITTYLMSSSASMIEFSQRSCIDDTDCPPFFMLQWTVPLQHKQIMEIEMLQEWIAGSNCTMCEVHRWDGYHCCKMPSIWSFNLACDDMSSWNWLSTTLT